MVFSGHGFIPGFDKGPHLLSILLYDSEEKRKAHVKNIEEHMNYKKKDSSSYVAHRTWSIFYSPDNDLEIISAMNTFPELRGLGIAQSLLQDGEYIKDNLVSELSEKMVVRTAITEIRDNSEPAGWTTRQAQQMDGYELQNDFTFLKTVTYS